MYYIYYHDQYVGSSEEWVDMPTGYRLTTEPPEERPDKPSVDEIPPITPNMVVIERFSDEDVAVIRAKLETIDPIVADALELVLRHTQGDIERVNALVKKMKGTKNKKL